MRPGSWELFPGSFPPRCRTVAGVNPAAVGPLFIPLFLLIAFLVHYGVMRRPRTRERVLTVALLWGLGLGMGVGELLAGVPHLVAPAFSAQQIGFAPSAFQWRWAGRTSPSPCWGCCA